MGLSLCLPGCVCVCVYECASVGSSLYADHSKLISKLITYDMREVKLCFRASGLWTPLLC